MKARHIALVAGAALLAAAYTVSAQAATPLGAALVLQDQAALRGAARESAPAQAQLWKGEALEVRGERLDYWQVWDYRRERGGYVRKTQLLRTGSDTAELLAAMRITRDQPGAEALGLGLAAAFVQAAPAELLQGPAGAEALDAMGSLAERLADRASASQTQVLSKSAEAALAGHLDVAARYGLRFTNIEREGGQQLLCYEGEAFRRLLASTASAPEQRVRAALALTRPECLNPLDTPSDREARDIWRAGVLDLVKAETLAAHWKNRLLMRRASVWSSLAFARARRGDLVGANAAAQRAMADFGSIAPTELAEDDGANYNDAAMRANAIRWAAVPNITNVKNLRIQPGTAEGETCVSVGDAKRCTWGLVWSASATLNREGNALALAVQPADGWRELWVFRKDVKGNWQAEVLPPATAVGLGYAEFAGWVPGGKQILLARESRAEGRYSRRYEVMNLDTLTAERQAGDSSILGAFQRWQDPAWRGQSLTRR